MTLESKCTPCNRQSARDIERVEVASHGYYITYVCGHTGYTSKKRLEIQEELGIGAMTKEDYERIVNTNKEVKNGNE